MITKDARERKGLPVTTGVLDYFPDALLEVARCSFVGNQQHNPGQPLHWAKEKSTDEADALVRHLLERGKLDTDGVRHSAKVAWRALAMLQREIEASRTRGLEPYVRNWTPGPPPEKPCPRGLTEGERLNRQLEAPTAPGNVGRMSAIKSATEIEGVL